ncbi:hypothetical protein JH06_3784 [Blastocystis sp. subtype 4]|uniref:hypothetical protein n=1 Tax=Blastocystis sp. subtype 4 TaxID=944170 RepID=UPI000711433B|nr:hypothetical protein JH06_3784 [Blastocystis sp. subtype 4]KNB42558.1 hypothetical protein JH06_3784 [Blastocystis sp. subtype 4]|eukprot:XP_014526001.1 hypothetical protein JH06_3784 [Blastocystis sp. subtype 4]
MLFDISKAEKRYIIDGLKQDIRTDGRKNNQMRGLEIETNILQQSHGSSRVRFSNEGTDVITSVKAEVQPIGDDFVLENQIEMTVAYTASANPEYRNRSIEVNGNVIAESITKILLSPGAMNLEELIIVPKQFCWKLFIDVEIYEDSGNVIDVSLLSILVALRTTRLPITTPLKNFDQEEKDFDIDDDPTHFRRLSCMTIPIGVTINKVADTIFVDATREEELCAESSLLVCVNRRKEIVSVQNQQGRIDPNTLLGSLQVASMVSDKLFSLLDAVIEQDDLLWTSNELPTNRGLFV